MKRRAQNKKRIRIVCCVLLFFTLGGAGYFGLRVYREISPQLASERIYQKVREQAKQEKGVGYDGPDFDWLLSVNPDVVGWIDGADIGIDYPVVQGIDNDYYLHHLWDRTPSEIGAIFLDYEDDPNFMDDLSVIYGHHITLDRMFSPLSHYKDQSFYEEHPVMILYTREKKKYRLELFAGTVFSGTGEVFHTTWNTKKEKEAWIKERIASSTFQSPIRPTIADRLVALCTCSYEFYNARYAVFARLVEET